MEYKYRVVVQELEPLSSKPFQLVHDITGVPQSTTVQTGRTSASHGMRYEQSL